MQLNLKQNICPNHPPFSHSTSCNVQLASTKKPVSFSIPPLQKTLIFFSFLDSLVSLQLVAPTSPMAAAIASPTAASIVCSSRHKDQTFRYSVSITRATLSFAVVPFHHSSSSSSSIKLCSFHGNFRRTSDVSFSFSVRFQTDIYTCYILHYWLCYILICLFGFELTRNLRKYKNILNLVVLTERMYQLY